MERGVSPSPTPAQDPNRIASVRKSSAYRLFPIVEPTPPSSPVTLQRNTLTKAAGSARRRSSSLENNARNAASTTCLPSATSTGTTLPSTSFTRKHSLPELPPLRTTAQAQAQAIDRGNGVVSPDVVPRPHTAVDRAFDQNVHNGSNSAPVNSSISMRDRHVSLQKQIQTVCYGENIPAAPRSFGSNLPLTPVEENQVFSSLHSARLRSKPRPNLTISVDKSRQEGKAPPPPPKAAPPPPPRSAPANPAKSAHSPKPSPKRGPHSAIESRADSELPRTPTRAVAQQQSDALRNSDLKVRELTVSPGTVSARGLSGQQPSEPTSDMLSRDILEKPLPPGPQASLEPPSSKFSVTTARPSTSDGIRNSSRGNQSPRAQRTGLGISHVIEQPSQPPRVSLRSRLLPGSRGRTTPEPRANELTPVSPETVRRTPKPDWKDLADPASHYPRRVRTPEPALDKINHSQLAAPADIVRPASAQSTYAKPRTRDSPKTSGSATSALDPGPSAALAAARANVAALRNSGSSTESPGGTERSSRSSGPDFAGLRRVRSDMLLRRPSSPAQPDAVETLKELSEESEAMHARYATLRAERQKLSGRIIANLMDQPSNAELANIILDDQLSLAAVSSSMDICFAKLKSLDCRKEDAIAALIAKTTQSNKTPSDNIAAMIASMAVSRKASTAPSVESATRYALTGRSTPDTTDSSSTHRLTQPSTRTMSYGSDAESLDYRYSSSSRKHSYGADSVLRPDSFERAATATIPEVVENPYSNTRSQSSGQSMNDDKEPIVAYAREIIIDVKSSPRLESGEGLEEQHPQKITITGSKAAKILGLLEDNREPPLSNRVGGDAQRDVGTGGLLSPKIDDSHDNAASLHSFRTDDSGFDSTDPMSSVQDLEQQLKNFPKPNAPLEPDPGHRRDTGGSFLTNGSSADSCSEPEPLPPRRRGTNKRASGALRKRDPSAHTIHVHLDRNMDHEELMDLQSSYMDIYRRLRPDVDSHT